MENSTLPVIVVDGAGDVEGEVRPTAILSKTPNTINYAQEIKAQSRHKFNTTLYPARIYSDLDEFLARRERIPPRPRYENENQLCLPASHAVVHFLHGPRRTIEYFTDPFNCIKALRQEDPEHNRERSSALLFLRGHTSPAWLRSIMENFHTDLEFFNSNLPTRNICRHDYFSYPRLPASNDNMLQLRIMTIGSRGETDGEHSDQNVDRMRMAAEKDMEVYRQHLKLRLGSDVLLGDSIVRDHFVLDEEYFVVEQELSIYMHFSSSGWLGLICSDIGNSLAEGPPGPWLTAADRKATRPYEMFQPIIQHMKRDWSSSHTLQETAETAAHKLYAQTASLLPLDYGRYLDLALAAEDPFYALTDALQLSASSENQLMGLLEHIISRDTDYKSLNKKAPTLSNLLYCRGILEAHIRRLDGTVAFIRNHRQHIWNGDRTVQIPKQPKAIVAARDLSVNYEHLLKRATHLYARCNSGMSSITDNVMISENRQVMKHQKRLGKLTFLGTLFIPLSFSTSLFGMNITLLDQGSGQLWAWGIVSIGVLGLTLLVFFFEKVLSSCQNLWRRVCHLCKESQVDLGKQP